MSISDQASQEDSRSETPLRDGDDRPRDNRAEKGDSKSDEHPIGKRRRARPRSSYKRLLRSISRDSQNRGKKAKSFFVLDIGSEMNTGEAVPQWEAAELLGIRNQKEFEILFEDVYNPELYD